LLLFQFLKVVGSFGAGVVDAIIEAGGMVWAVLKGAFLGVTATFRNAMLDSLIAIAAKFNELMPDFLKNKGFTINIAGLEDLKIAGTSIGNEINKAIAETSPSTFKKEVGEFWDKRIDDQKKVVEAMNKKDFGVDAQKLTDAGKNIEGSLKVGSDGLVDAGKKVAAEIKAAAAELRSSVERVGRSLEEQSTDSLRGLVGRLSDQKARSEIADRRVIDSTQIGGYRSAGTSMLANELAAAQRELNQRSQIQAYAARYGESAARGAFGDALTDRALRDLTDTSIRTSNAVENLNRNVAELLGKPQG
jgi:hypothetical protein